MGRVRRSVFDSRRAVAAPPQVVGYRRHLAGPAKGRALLAYLSEPFLSENEERKTYSRSEGVLSLEIARALNSLGFIVDGVDWRDYTFSLSRHYDVLFGMGPHYERIRQSLTRSTTTIYFGTGAHWGYESERESARAKQLLLRKRVWIEPKGDGRESRRRGVGRFVRCDGPGLEACGNHIPIDSLGSARQIVERFSSVAYVKNMIEVLAPAIEASPRSEAQNPEHGLILKALCLLEALLVSSGELHDEYAVIVAVKGGPDLDGG